MFASGGALVSDMHLVFRLGAYLVDNWGPNGERDMIKDNGDPATGKNQNPTNAPYNLRGLPNGFTRVTRNGVICLTRIRMAIIR